MYNGLQGGSTGFLLGGTTGTSQPASSTGLAVQGPTDARQTLQATVNPNNYAVPGDGVRLSANTTQDTGVAIDPAVQAAAAKAAADAAKAGVLRGDITSLVQRIKDVMNARYGQADAAAAEQTGKLNSRFQAESGDVAQQVTDNTNAAAGSFAGRGTKDSSDYGNSVDQITRGGETQIRGLGQDLQDSLAGVGSWLTGQKAGFDTEKANQDSIIAHLNDETDPGRLTDLRNSIDAKLNQLKSNTDTQTQAQNVSALNAIAPTNARAQSLQTTLAKIVGGNAPAGQRLSVGQQLIQAANLPAEEAQKLALAFQSDIQSTDPAKQQQ